MFQLPASSPDSVEWGQPVNWSHPLNHRGLKLWWLAVTNRQGFGSTVCRDLCRMNHGTLTNMDPATDWSGASHPGGYGSLDFDGSNDFVTNAAFAWPGGPITISWWNFARGGNNAFNIGGGESAGSRVLCHGPFSDNNLYWDYGNSTAGSGRISTSYAAYMNLWTHVTLVADSTSFQAIYINGKLVTSQAASVNPAARTSIRFGRATESHNGKINDFRVSARVYSPVEVDQHHQLSRRFNLDLLNRIRVPRYAVVEAAAGASHNKLFGQKLHSSKLYGKVA